MCDWIIKKQQLFHETFTASNKWLKNNPAYSKGDTIYDDCMRTRAKDLILKSDMKREWIALCEDLYPKVSKDRNVKIKAFVTVMLINLDFEEICVRIPGKANPTRFVNFNF